MFTTQANSKHNALSLKIKNKVPFCSTSSRVVLEEP